MAEGCFIYGMGRFQLGFVSKFRYMSQLALTCRLSVFALHYHKSKVEVPPGLAMPGDIDLALAAQEGLTISLPENVEVFRAMCRFWTIFAPVARIYYGPDLESFLNQTAALEYVEGTYRQLLAWADSLPLPLVRQPGSSHAVCLMQ